MRKMSKWIFAAVAAGALVLSVPSSANAQVAFGGTFGGPHGRFSIGIGAPAFPVGAYVPYPYVRHIYLRPDYGYGFYYGDQWVPVQPYGSRYIVIERPAYYGYGYGQRYHRRDFRNDRRWDDHHRRDWDDRYRRDWR